MLVPHISSSDDFHNITKLSIIICVVKAFFYKMRIPSVNNPVVYSNSF